MIFNIKILAMLSLLFLLFGCNQNITTQNLVAKEISLEETLIFVGIDANVKYSDETVFINYNLPVKYEEDLILANNYILGAAYEEFPNSEYRLVYEIDELAYFTETDSDNVKNYIEGKISFLEFAEKVNVYVR